MSLPQMSVSGAVLIAVIAVVRVLAIHRLPKRVFVLLWGVVLLRLLVPFSIPAQTSVYSHMPGQTFIWYEAGAPDFGGFQAAGETGTAEGVRPDRKEGAGEPTAHESFFFPAYRIVWLAGALAAALFFLVCYVRCRREFGMSLPVENAFAVRWREEHRRWRAIQIRQSDQIAAPLTYGVFCPVILMPKRTDWDDEGQISCVLLHEYIHICRWDALWKLFAAAALCIHWFNPMVWAMYVLFNKDIELSCDECVVQRLGRDARAVYARALIAMEEKKSGILPLYSNFSRNAIEERIQEIMRAKKITVGVTVISAVLVAGIAAVFVTSAKADSAQVAGTPDASGERLVYVGSFDGETLTFDEVEWVVVPGARASELGISEEDAPSGFNVYNETVLTEKLPMAADCACTVLDWTGNYKSMKVTPEELNQILKAREGTQIPYQIIVENGEIVALTEHYVP